MKHELVIIGNRAILIMSIVEGFTHFGKETEQCG